MHRIITFVILLAAATGFGANLTEKSITGTGGITVSSNLTTHKVVVDGSGISGAGIPIQAGAGNANTFTNPAIISSATISGTFTQTVAAKALDLTGAIQFSKTTGKLSDSNGVGRIKFAYGGGVDLNGTNGNPGFTVDKDGNALSVGVLTGNGSGLTNLLHGPTVSGVSGVTVALSQNPDGSTNFGLTVTGGGSTQMVTAAIGDLTSTNSILPALTNQLDVGSFLKPVRTNWANDFTAKDGFLGTGASNGRLGLSDTNGTTNVVVSSDSNGQITAYQMTIATNTANLSTSSNPTNQYTTGTLYTNAAQRSFLVGSAVLNGGVSGSANITLLYTNSTGGYQIPMQTGAGLATTDMFPFSALLDASATFTFVSTMGTGATGSLTNVVLWKF